METPRIRTVKRERMSVADAIRRLEAHGSDSDPVWVHGKETSPIQLSYTMSGLTDACSIRLTYHGGPPGHLRKIRGTLSGMVRERARKYERRTCTR
jgi:hypothetical protein